MVNPVGTGLAMLGVVVVLPLILGGFSGMWRQAWFLFLFGLAFGAAELALILFVPAVGTFVAEVSR